MRQASTAAVSRAVCSSRSDATAVGTCTGSEPGAGGWVVDDGGGDVDGAALRGVGGGGVGELDVVGDVRGGQGGVGLAGGVFDQQVTVAVEVEDAPLGAVGDECFPGGEGAVV